MLELEDQLEIRLVGPVEETMVFPAGSKIVENGNFFKVISNGEVWSFPWASILYLVYSETDFDKNESSGGVLPEPIDFSAAAKNLGNLMNSIQNAKMPKLPK